MTVDVVKLVFIFAKVFVEMFLNNLFKVMKIVRTFGIDAFVEDEVPAVFLVNEGIAAVRAAQGIVFIKPVVIRREVGIAYFAF